MKVMMISNIYKGSTSHNFKKKEIMINILYSTLLLFMDSSKWIPSTSISKHSLMSLIHELRIKHCYVLMHNFIVLYTKLAHSHQYYIFTKTITPITYHISIIPLYMYGGGMKNNYHLHRIEWKVGFRKSCCIKVALVVQCNTQTF
jgi:hypothetical protein